MDLYTIRLIGVMQSSSGFDLHVVPLISLSWLLNLIAMTWTPRLYWAICRHTIKMNRKTLRCKKSKNLSWEVLHAQYNWHEASGICEMPKQLNMLMSLEFKRNNCPYPLFLDASGFIHVLHMWFVYRPIMTIVARCIYLYFKKYVNSCLTRKYICFIHEIHTHNVKLSSNIHVYILSFLPWDHQKDQIIVDPHCVNGQCRTVF